MKEEFVRKLRKDGLPLIFCPGCGYGTALNSFLRAMETLDLKKGDVGFFSGAGCGCWLPLYLDYDVAHTLHGRPIAFAQGAKMARPDKTVVVFTGDGDNVGIGGNHFIHAARRNIDITVVQMSNMVYGMTGAQKAPTTPLMGKTKSSPYGNEEEPFDLGRLSVAAGATYFARWTTAHPIQLEKAYVEAIRHKGFSVIEIISQCPTGAGRNIYGSDKGYEMLEAFRREYTPLRPGEAPDLNDTRMRLGTLIDIQRPTIHDNLEVCKGRVAK